MKLLVNGMRSKIKEFIGYQEIRRFSVMVNKCKIYDKHTWIRSIYYKSVNVKKFAN